MKYWIISDTHFGHDKIIDFCNRPKDFETKILSNIWDIPEDDILIHLGDICWGNDLKWHNLLNAGTPYNKKWLIRGNHDKKTNTWYLNHGWDIVADSILLNIYGKKTLFSHRPQEPGNWYDINIHGHLHNTGHHKTIDDNKHINIYMEHHYSPQNLQKIIQKKILKGD